MARCPYCNENLQSKPKRKKKCPRCGKHIYVRKGQLRTEQDIAAERLERFGISPAMFERHRKALSRQFGFRASLNDTIWRCLNVSLANTHDLQDRQALYYEMAQLVRTEQRDPLPYLREANMCILRHLQAHGFTKVKTHTCNDDIVCAPCQAASKKIFDIDYALRALPIPNNCTSETSCRCWYVAADTTEPLRQISLGRRRTTWIRRLLRLCFLAFIGLLLYP